MIADAELTVVNKSEPDTDTRLVRVWCGLLLTDGTEPVTRQSVIVHEGYNLLQITWRGVGAGGEVTGAALWRRKNDVKPLGKSGKIAGSTHLRPHARSQVIMEWQFNLLRSQIS